MDQNRVTMAQMEADVDIVSNFRYIQTMADPCSSILAKIIPPGHLINTTLIVNEELFTLHFT